MLYGTGISFLLRAVHQFGHLTDVDIDRAVLYTAPATDALYTVVIFVHIIFKFVHEALTHAMQLGSPGVVARAVNGEQWKHTAVPIAHALALFAVGFVLDVKTPASGT